MGQIKNIKLHIVTDIKVSMENVKQNMVVKLEEEEDLNEEEEVVYHHQCAPSWEHEDAISEHLSYSEHYWYRVYKDLIDAENMQEEEEEGKLTRSDDTIKKIMDVKESLLIKYGVKGKKSLLNKRSTKTRTGYVCTTCITAQERKEEEDDTAKLTDYNEFYTQITFRDRKELKQRKKIHHLRKKLPVTKTCHYCERIFTRTNDLKRHLETHETLRKVYKCDHCEKTFLANRIKLRHMRCKHRP